MNLTAANRTSTDRLPHGVRGWLLLLCLMLTVVGPAIAIALMLVAPPPAIGWAVTGASLLFGIWAGMQLWRVRPGAVLWARRALLAGLAADGLTALTQATAAQPLNGALLWQVEWQLMPSAVFFTLCWVYLQRSRRVQATYGLGGRDR